MIQSDAQVVKEFPVLRIIKLPVLEGKFHVNLRARIHSLELRSCLYKIDTNYNQYRGSCA